MYYVFSGVGIHGVCFRVRVVNQACKAITSRAALFLFVCGFVLWKLFFVVCYLVCSCSTVFKPSFCFLCSSSCCVVFWGRLFARYVFFFSVVVVVVLVLVVVLLGL